MKFDCRTQSNLNWILYYPDFQIRLNSIEIRLRSIGSIEIRLHSIEIRLRSITTISHFVLKGDRNNRNAFTAADMRGCKWCSSVLNIVRFPFSKKTKICLPLFFQLPTSSQSSIFESNKFTFDFNGIMQYGIRGLGNKEFYFYMSHFSFLNNN